MNPPFHRPLEIWIDRGGTFTDLIALHPDGRQDRLKLLSHDPAHPEDSALRGIRHLSAGHQGPVVVRMGTTVATNALLERRGAPTLLLVTRGFRDALAIGHQARPDIFARHIVKPAPLAALVVEVDERVAADGTVLRPLDEEAAKAALADARMQGIASVAICLMHGFAHPAHEARLAELATQAGFTSISASHAVSPLIRFVPRGQTTVADAYLSPVLRTYVAEVESGLPPGTRLLFMQSNGGLAEASAFRGRDAVLSGPAGGVVGMVEAGRDAGFNHLIGFDMGGTSTDVSHWSGQLERSFETSVAGVRLRAPMLDIHTVAAGGGSICRLEAGRLVVGPQSAGAVPGPACYRLGGPLTITDCNLALGRIQPRAFPAVFGPAGNQPLDADAAHRALGRLADDVAAETGRRLSPLELAEGLIGIANAHMADAIRRISIARGHDPATHALVAFGGAGGQHACALADALGMKAAVLPVDAGLLSARGIGAADLIVTRERTVALPFGPTLDTQAPPLAEALGAEARAALEAQGLPLAALHLRLIAHVRYAGADTALPLPFGPMPSMQADFEAAHQARFGFLTPEAPLLLDMLEAEARGTPPGAARASPGFTTTGKSHPPRVRLHAGGQGVEAPLIPRDTLSPGARVQGPAIIADSGSTALVAPGWGARVHASGALILERTGTASASATARDARDPIRLELMNALFFSIASEMGVALMSSARSVNIKERLDFSCAIFDGEGRLVANAPHIPVHLGSMGASVTHVIEAARASGRPLAEGDVQVLNAPWAGGTHLPDITVIRPVFLPGHSGPAAFVAARGHHADIGGITPGSMPAASRTIEEEGVVLDNLPLVHDGRFQAGAIRHQLLAAAHPARAPETNLADLAAQVAACERGAAGLRAAAEVHGVPALLAAMDAIMDNAAQAVARLIETLPEGEAEVPMDEGAVIRVALRVDRHTRRLTVDFTGTSEQRPGNFNAPAAVTRAALLYVLRCLIDLPIPLNDGCLRPVTLIIPEGTLLNPAPGAAVVAGNVETSQVVTDALFAAFKGLAASAGSMSNLTFGNRNHQYYETIAGGSGAGPGFPGASAVQTHMTNSHLTDPEVLETRFPVRVELFRIRSGSGGGGQFPGGDGAVRRLSFHDGMTVSILSNRRTTCPFGLMGGGDAAPGENRLIRASGEVVPLGSTASVDVGPGDMIEIATPGGGGWGAPQPAP